MTSSSATPPQAPAWTPRQPPRRKRHRIAWAALGTFLILAILAIYATVHQGVRTINFKQGSISFQTLRPSEIQQQQPRIQAEVSAARANVQQNVQQQAGPAASVPNISGYWYSNSGLVYQVEQYGNGAVVQEESSYGVTAVGEGLVFDDHADFNYRAFNNSSGQAIFSFRSDGTILAEFNNTTYGTSSQAILTRH